MKKMKSRAIIILIIIVYVFFGHVCKLVNNCQEFYENRHFKENINNNCHLLDLPTELPQLKFDCVKNDNRRTRNLLYFSAFVSIVHSNFSTFSFKCLKFSRTATDDSLIKPPGEITGRRSDRLSCDFRFNFHEWSYYLNYDDEKCVEDAISNSKYLVGNKCVRFIGFEKGKGEGRLFTIEKSNYKKALEFVAVSALNHSKTSAAYFDFSFESPSLKPLPLDLSPLAHLAVESLDLSNFQLKEIADDFFPPIQALRNLNLNNCGLKTIRTNAFRAIPHLRHLNLADNNFITGQNAILSLRHVETLDFKRNKNLKFDVLFLNERVPLLRCLALSGIEEFSVESNVRMENLEKLDLSRVSRFYFSRYSAIEQITFDFPRLQRLNLSAAPSFDDEKVRFVDLTQLESLDLSRNARANFTKYLAFFPNLTAVGRLNLAENGFKDTSTARLFLSNIQVLAHLDLSQNLIESWNETLFDDGSAAGELCLDLSYNNISIVNEAMLADFKTLRNVTLNGNPFDCTSCVVEPFYRWLLQTQQPTSSSSYKCFYPKEYINTLVTQLNIDSELCAEKVFNWLLKALLPALITLLLVAITVFLSLKYKWHLRYLFHLIRARMNARRNDSAVNLTTLWNYDAFVSYCSLDNNWVVQQLIPHLEKEEPALHLCIHERDFLAGGTIMENIIHSIDQSRKSLFLISNQFIRSNWCMWELEMAQHKLYEDGSDVLVLVLLGNLEGQSIPRTLQRLMATRTYLIWPETKNATECKLFWSRLRQYIGRCRCRQAQGEFINQ